MPSPARRATRSTSVGAMNSAASRPVPSAAHSAWRRLPERLANASAAASALTSPSSSAARRLRSAISTSGAMRRASTMRDAAAADRPCTSRKPRRNAGCGFEGKLKQRRASSGIFGWKCASILVFCFLFSPFICPSDRGIFPTSPSPQPLHRPGGGAMTSLSPRGEASRTKKETCVSFLACERAIRCSGSPRIKGTLCCGVITTPPSLTLASSGTLTHNPSRSLAHQPAIPPRRVVAHPAPGSRANKNPAAVN